MDPQTTVPVRPLRWARFGSSPTERALAREVAVALVHDAGTTAVLMASPTDLIDLGVGFTLTEGIASEHTGIVDFEVVEIEPGFEVRMWLSPGAGAGLAARRRRMAGPTGCGLCGIDSLAEAVRPTPRVGEGLRVTAAALLDALPAMEAAQALGRRTRAAHAAGLWSPTQGLLAVREDVGRHNALDKLAGATLGATGPTAVLLTSRVSVEMVQKTAAMGAQLICAVSAPTDLAVRTADQAGITLCAVARADGFEVFTRPDRIVA